MKDTDWATQTCIYGWHVRGLWPEGADGTEPDAHLLFTDSPVRGARGSRTASAANAAAARSSGNNEAAQSGGVLDHSVDAQAASGGLE